MAMLLSASLVVDRCLHLRDMDLSLVEMRPSNPLVLPQPSAETTLLISPVTIATTKPLHTIVFRVSKTVVEH